MKRGTAQGWLASLWIFGFSAIGLTLFIQDTVYNLFGNQSQIVWDWFYKAIMPTVSLMIGVMVAQYLRGGVDRRYGGKLVFSIAMVLSLSYLTIIGIVVAAIAIRFSLAPLSASGTFLGIHQALTSASLGAFFVSTDVTDQAE